jgi:hypothetical protein
MKIIRRFISLDSYKFVQRLETHGFEREHAEIVINSISGLVDSTLTNLARNAVLRSELDKSMYMHKVDFNQVKSEAQFMEKNEFAILKDNLSRLDSEIDKLNQRINEDLSRVQKNVRLDLSLEKSVIREKQSNLELRIIELDSKIDSEISALKTTLETVEWDLFKTLFPIFSAAGALTFSYLRFVS